MGDEVVETNSVVENVPVIEKPKSKILWIIIISLVAFVIVISLFAFLYFKYFQYPVGTWGCLGEDDYDSKYNCMIEKAIAKQDSSLCEPIHWISTRMECVQVVEQDPEFCRDTSAGDKSYCYIAASKYTRDTNTCMKGQDEWGSNEWGAVKCAKELAVELKDPESCKPIMDGRGWCLTAVALDTKNITVCEGITEANYREGCLIDVATLTDDLSICDTLTFGRRGDQCFDEFASIRANVELCENVTDLLRRNYCFKTLSRELEDITVCDRITDEDIKNDCELELKPINNSLTG